MLRRVGFALAALAVTVPCSAQTAAIPGWQAWYGCWTVAQRDEDMRASGARIVCFTPTSNRDVVQISALADGKIVHRDSIDATGREHPVGDAGCTGSESGHWSSDGRRVFLDSKLSCDGAVTHVKAVVAMTPSGDWVDVRGVSTAGHEVVRVARYRDVGLPESIPAEIAGAIRELAAGIPAARIVAGASVPASAVIEASQHLDPDVLEAWVVESGQQFASDANALRQMADANVPGTVTDAVVATQANSRDVYGYWGSEPYGRGASDYWDQGTGERLIFRAWVYDPWGYGLGLWQYGMYRTRYAFGTEPWNMFYGRGFWFGGARRSSVGYVYPPVLVLHDEQPGTAPSGRPAKPTESPINGNGGKRASPRR